MTALFVLVVEHDVMIAALLAELLANLMTADMNLADGSGVSVVDCVCRARPVPHLDISGNVFQPAVPGAVLLRKPFRKADLVQAIGRTLNLDGVERPSSLVPPPAS